jgi:hypothetical protein
MRITEYLDSSPNGALLSNAELARHYTGRGLRRVMQGYYLLVTTLVLGGIYVWLKAEGGTGVRLTRVTAEQTELFLMASLVPLALAALSGLGMVLLGLWNCLDNAPTRFSARALGMGALVCAVLAPTLVGYCAYTGGARHWSVLLHGLDGLTKLDFFRGPFLLLMVSLLFALFSFVFFSLLVRVLAAGSGERHLTRGVIHNLLLTALVFGGTLGLPMHLYPRASLLPIVVGLAAVWAICFIWHVFLVAGVRTELTTKPWLVKGSSRANLPVIRMATANWVGNPARQPSDPCLN